MDGYLKKLRRLKKLTVREAAERAGLCYASLSDVENGKQPLFKDIGKLSKLAEVYGVDIKSILGKETLEDLPIYKIYSSLDDKDRALIDRLANRLFKKKHSLRFFNV